MAICLILISMMYLFQSDKSFSPREEMKFVIVPEKNIKDLKVAILKTTVLNNLVDVEQ